MVRLWVASAGKQAARVVVVRSEEHGGGRKFTTMEVMLQLFATPFFLVPIDIKEYRTCSSNFCSHESRHNEKKAESVAVGEQRWLVL